MAWEGRLSLRSPLKPVGSCFQNHPAGVRLRAMYRLFHPFPFSRPFAQDSIRRRPNIRRSERHR